VRHVHHAAHAEEDNVSAGEQRVDCREHDNVDDDLHGLRHPFVDLEQRVVLSHFVKSVVPQAPTLPWMGRVGRRSAVKAAGVG